MNKTHIGFEWDLFIRDYKAFIFKDLRTLKELSYKTTVTTNVLGGLSNGRLNYVGRVTLDKILKEMNLYYNFYTDKK